MSMTHDLTPPAAAGEYAATAAWPEDVRADDDATILLNELGALGPGAWADLEGGLMLAGMIDSPVV